MNEPNAISVILTELVSFYIITIERGIQRQAVDLGKRFWLFIIQQPSLGRVMI
jgi:hypothetical protein